MNLSVYSTVLLCNIYLHTVGLWLKTMGKLGIRIDIIMVNWIDYEDSV